MFMSDYFLTEQYVPAMITSTKKLNGVYREYPATICAEETFLQIQYAVPISNGIAKNIGKRTISRRLPRLIPRTIESFQIMGFLQGEMSKTHRGPVTICNSEISLIRRTLKWFSNNWGVANKDWHWYIKLNIPEIQDKECVSQLSSELIEYWLSSGVAYESRFPTTVSFIHNTSNIIPSNQGTLILERRGPVFVQTLQEFISNSFSLALSASQEEIVGFLQGLIAAESCINFRLASGHRRVFVCSCDDNERELIVDLLAKIGIQAKNYPSVRATIVSGKKNLLRMHELDLVSLHPDKHARFLEMVSSYS